MASRVNICDVKILENPTRFVDKFKLEIIFEVFENLPHDLEWELVYVGSGTSREYDQVLDSVLVGPVPEGRHKFVFDADSPNVAKIPTDDVVGVSVVLLRCKYNDQEFINLGWFVSNEYEDEELKENPPATPQVDKLTRVIQTDSLRITTFTIKWADDEVLPQPDADEGDKVFAEEELMPIEDNEEEEDDDDDDDEEDDVAEVDLNESIDKDNERVAKALDSMDTQDAEMEIDNGNKIGLQEESSKMNNQSTQPLNDKTNEIEME